MGLYEIISTTSDVVVQMILDALIRFGLFVDKLRAQTCDGAANINQSGRCKAIFQIISE